MKKLSIVADENIPSLHEYFSPYGQIKALPGREISATDVAGADVLLVRSVTQVNEQLLANSSVKFVGTCTIGVDHLDLDFLNVQKIVYSSAPGCNAGGVVQYVLAALASYRPDWLQRSVGVVGCGNVGGRIYRILHRLGVDCSAYDPFLNDADIKLVSWREVLQKDIICFHTPLTRSEEHATYHLLDAQSLALVNNDVMLINAGRGDVFDNSALNDFLRENTGAAAVIDVWENEPNLSRELFSRVDCATPHIAGYSFEGRLNGTTMIHAALCDFLEVPEYEYHAHNQKIRNSILGESVEIRCTSFNDAILQTYSIDKDDKYMREGINFDSAGERNIAKQFDALRKGYWQRREFSHYRVSVDSESLGSQLHACGFASGK